MFLVRLWAEVIPLDFSLGFATGHSCVTAGLVVQGDDFNIVCRRRPGSPRY